jgi:hypothetical protein
MDVFILIITGLIFISLCDIIILLKRILIVLVQILNNRSRM